MNITYCFLMIVAMFSLEASQIYSVFTKEAPQAIGPYSQAVRAGDYLFVSGQLPIDPETGLFAGDEIESQTEQVIHNIEAILSAEGLSLENVVKAEVYLKDLEDFQKMNQVYAKWFSGQVKPSRQAMQVARLPKDALIEISCIAFIPWR